jgi:hypothetical protein
MLIAITDACIFIDLIDLKITAPFFSLDIEVHTTIDVWNELYESHQETLKAYQSVDKLTIHILEEHEIDELIEMRYPKSLSPADQTVIYIAEKLDAILLSSDKAVRNFSKSKAIDHHGMFWIFDQLVEKSIITKYFATLKLKYLVKNNVMYNNNVKLLLEAEKRFTLWNQ